MTLVAKLMVCLAVVALLAAPLPALTSLAAAMQACSHCPSKTAMPECCAGAAVPSTAITLPAPQQEWVPLSGVEDTALSAKIEARTLLAVASNPSPPPTCASLCQFRN